jgi:hypothetical protein
MAALLSASHQMMKLPTDVIATARLNEHAFFKMNFSRNHKDVTDGAGERK